jgi:hypothetical protein
MLPLPCGMPGCIKAARQAQVVAHFQPPSLVSGFRGSLCLVCRLPAAACAPVRAGSGTGSRHTGAQRAQRRLSARSDGTAGHRSPAGHADAAGGTCLSSYCFHLLACVGVFGLCASLLRCVRVDGAACQAAGVSLECHGPFTTHALNPAGAAARRQPRGAAAGCAGAAAAAAGCGAGRRRQQRRRLMLCANCHACVTLS